MKLFVIITLLILFTLTSCSKCDCSAENFEKVSKSGMQKQKVEYILSTKPSAVMMNDGCQIVKYSCGDNYIIVSYYESNSVNYSLFNTKYNWMTFDEKY